MLESVVSTLLNRVLGTYVSNLDSSQLKIGIWSGKLIDIIHYKVNFSKTHVQDKSLYAI
jgi:hypothetical protein